MSMLVLLIAGLFGFAVVILIILAIIFAKKK